MDDIIAIANKYWHNAGRTGRAHYIAAEVYAKRHRAVGIPSVIFSTIVATSVFSTLNDSVDIRIRILTGVVALLAAILAALQAFLGYGDRAEKHRSAGARYGKVRRDIDIFLLKLKANGFANDAEAINALQQIGDEMGVLAADNPNLTEPIYQQARREFASLQEAANNGQSDSLPTASFKD